MLDMESGTIHPKLEPGAGPGGEAEIPYCWTQSATEDSNSSQRFTSPELNIHMDSQDYQHTQDAAFQQQRYMTHSEPDLLHTYQHYEPPNQHFSLEYAQPASDCYYDNGNYYTGGEFPTAFNSDINDNTSHVNKSYDPNSSCSMLTLTQTKQEFTFNYNNDTSASSCTFQINQCMYPWHSTLTASFSVSFADFFDWFLLSFQFLLDF